MIALIPGLADTLAYVRPEPRPSQENFAPVLAAAKTAKPPAAAPPATSARYEVQPGDNLTRIAKKLGYTDTAVLVRANSLKDPDRLTVGQVLTLPEHSVDSAPKSGTPKDKSTATPATAVAKASGRQSGQLVTASWYGPRHHGRLMANGKPFDMYADTVAHRKLPLGTRLTLTNPRNGSAAQVQVTDRGPYIPGRDLDVSFGVARKLGVLQAGVAKLRLEEG